MIQNVPLWVVVLLLVSIGCSSAAQIFQKLAAHDFATHTGPKLQLLFRRNIVLSVLFLGTGLLLWLVVLGRLELSIAYPMLSLGYVVVMLAARWLFHETIPPRRWLGTALIMLGISLLVGGVA
ncbi:MAG TPA: EamA family transporter [Candidatus Thiothrix moscowensis]|uniref:EamA family transporter n=1 Tax=unclassified Thiothrix TaxID=2636184 RepID=UPI001A22E369|nr:MULTISPECIES: EamA family transporter [unclassified Thiothrix]MBJ6611306.1 EamA family transporter [Candidatus Thiothrix moscowensis]HRJ53260.1 EamA family transporter [Candidatus Thiothrix moscowensis]HRJ93170.1 EamA family transporter [Candidatus Thiothrix moscowensis]